jgi:hypothetical protein
MLNLWQIDLLDADLVRSVVVQRFHFVTHLEVSARSRRFCYFIRSFWRSLDAVEECLIMERGREEKCEHNKTLLRGLLLKQPAPLTSHAGFGSLRGVGAQRAALV